MRVNFNNINLNIYRGVNTSFKASYKDLSYPSKYEKYEDEDEDDNEEEEDWESETIITGAKEAFNTIKTDLWLGFPIPTKRNLKALFKDPDAYLYEMSRPLSGNTINKEILSEIDLERRKDRKTDKALLKKVEYDDSTAIYYIQQGIDKLGFIDVNFETKGKIYVNYASTIVGREEYRNLLPILVQAVVEDYINTEKIIPELEAEPAEIGSLNFKRASLYKYYGADLKYVKENKNDIKSKVYPLVYMKPDKVLNILHKISNSSSRDFILDSTKETIEQIKSDF